MGIDLTAKKTLEFFIQSANLGQVLMLGRQRIYYKSRKYRYRSFGEEYLQDLGAVSVDSIDVSDYEEASYVADMNFPVKLKKSYDTVIDFGTSEHIFNQAAVIKNIHSFLNDGGHVIHVVPANNACGHGLYQFSPEYYFSVYNQDTGFELEFCGVANTGKAEIFEVLRPDGDERRNFRSVGGLAVIAIGKKVAKSFDIKVRQTDYVEHKKHNEPTQSVSNENSISYSEPRATRYDSPAWSLIKVLSRPIRLSFKLVKLYWFRTNPNCIRKL